MSKKTSSPSQTTAEITDSQIGKLQELFGAVLRKNRKDLLTGSVQAAIEKKGKSLQDALLEVVREYAEVEVKPQDEFLELISVGEKLVIDPIDGKKILAEANDLFAGIDSDFRNWKADEQGEAREETPVSVYEMVKDATFVQMFNSLSLEADKLYFTQDQIIGFVEKFPQWLRNDGYATFFLFKSHGNFFVARVSVDPDVELEVRVSRFEYYLVWDAEDHRRVVVPQLA